MRVRGEAPPHLVRQHSKSRFSPYPGQIQTRDGSSHSRQAGSGAAIRRNEKLRLYPNEPAFTTKRWECPASCEEA